MSFFKSLNRYRRPCKILFFPPGILLLVFLLFPASVNATNGAEEKKIVSQGETGKGVVAEVVEEEEDDEEDDDEIMVIDFGDPQEVLPNYPAFEIRYENIPPFKVKERLRSTDFFLCSECHDGKVLRVNKKVRKLRKAHRDKKLNHLSLKYGTKKSWCTTCHDMGQPNYLTLDGQAIHFDQSYLLCGQCHGEHLKDWLFGAHGKRMDSWRDEKTILLCTQCHNPHSPQIKPAPPKAPPKVREGHVLVDTNHEKRSKIWELLHKKNQENTK